MWTETMITAKPASGDEKIFNKKMQKQLYEDTILLQEHFSSFLASGDVTLTIGHIVCMCDFHSGTHDKYA